MRQVDEAWETQVPLLSVEGRDIGGGGDDSTGREYIARKLREVPKHVGVLVRHKASQVGLNFSRAEFSMRHSDHNTVTIDDGLLSPRFLFARDLASHWCIGVEYPSR